MERRSRLTSQWLGVLALAAWLVLIPGTQAQVRPYVGFAYPAGGQQGTTVQLRLGGQDLDDVNAVWFAGSGVTGRVIDYWRRLGPQEISLLNEQLKALKRTATAEAPAMAPAAGSEIPMALSTTPVEKPSAEPGKDDDALGCIARIERRTREYVPTPACASISSLVFLEVTIARDAEPGARELRVSTPRGVSNPLVFHVGQLPEVSRKAMLTAARQVLGKEALALRKRPADEVEDRITLPCTLNGQIASGEVNRYRFKVRKGQRLVITTQARQLVPFIADAVPGWFQPVLELHDAKGKELAFADDDRFNPDPVILHQVPEDGDEVLTVRDSIYRGREDFVYRISVGELPFITSLFPIGGQIGSQVAPRMDGCNLPKDRLSPPAGNLAQGIQWLTTSRKGLVSNRVPFALDTLHSGFDEEPNPTPATAQKVRLPITVNGRIGEPDDWDVFRFVGRSNAIIVAEVQARPLNSPLDSVLKLTDAAGTLFAFNDDHDDLEAGVNTHHADSYLRTRLPADGAYFVHIGDTARHGGRAYAYRLRLSAPRPDFALHVVPSSVTLRSKSGAPVTVYAVRKDGFTGPITLALTNPPTGFSASPVTLSRTQTVARLMLKTDLIATAAPVEISVVGRAKIAGQEVAHPAVPAEDRMQAFLWRHLVPAGDLKVLVFDPSRQPLPKRVARARPSSEIVPPQAIGAQAPGTTNTTALEPGAGKPKFSKQQIAGRLRQLRFLFEEGLLTDDFYAAKVAECEAAPERGTPNGTR